MTYVPSSVNGFRASHGPCRKTKISLCFVWGGSTATLGTHFLSFFQWHLIHRVCTYTPQTQASVHFQIMSVSLSVNGTEHVHLLWGMGSKAVGHSFPRPWHSEATIVTKVSFHDMTKYRNITTHLGLECIFYLYFCTFNLINFPRIWLNNRKSLFIFTLLTLLLIVTVVHLTMSCNHLWFWWVWQRIQHQVTTIDVIGEVMFTKLVSKLNTSQGAVNLDQPLRNVFFQEFIGDQV